MTTSVSLLAGLITLLRITVSASPLDLGSASQNSVQGEYIPTAFDHIQLIEDVLPEYEQLGGKAVPAIPFTLYKHGFPGGMNGTIPGYEANNDAVRMVFISEHNTPVTLASSAPLPPVFLGNKHIPLENYTQFTDICLRRSWRNNSAVFQKATSATRSFTDVRHSEDTFLSDLIALPAIQISWILTKISAANSDKYREVFGDILLDPSYVFDRDYYVIDTSRMAQVPVSAGDQSLAPTSTMYSLGAITLLRMDTSPSVSCTESCSRKLIPVAIQVASQVTPKNDTVVSKNFSRTESSESSWIMALLAARASVTGWGVAVGHILGLHEISAVVQRSFYNHLSPTHTLRIAMEPFMKYTMQFDSIMFAQYTSLSKSFAFGSSEGLASLVPVFANHYESEPWRDYLPSYYFAKHGLVVDDLSVSEPWDIVPQLQDNLKMERIAETYANNIMQASGYAVDDDVANDIQLQAMLDNLMADDGGRLGALVRQNNDKAEITTIAGLHHVLRTYFYINLWHGQNSLVSRSASALFMPALIPTFASIQFLSEDDASKNYTQTEILQHMPTAATTVAYAGFVELFISSPSFETYLGDEDTNVSVSHVYNGTLEVLSEEMKDVLQTGLEVLMDDLSVYLAETVARSSMSFVPSGTNELKRYPLSVTN